MDDYRLMVKDGGCMRNDVSVLRGKRIRRERSPHFQLDGADRGLRVKQRKGLKIDKKQRRSVL